MNFWPKEREEIINKLFIEDRSLCFKMLPTQQNNIHLWKIATKLLIFCKRLNMKRMPPADGGPDGRILPTLGTNQIAEYI